MRDSRNRREGKEKFQAEKLPESAIEEAIGWAVRLNYHRVAPRNQQDFKQWLQADPSHGIAWQRINSLNGFKNDLGPLAPALAHEALQTAQRMRSTRANDRRTALKVLSLVGVTAASGWLAREYLPWQSVLADASTGVGMQRTLQLDDGSVIMLNTDSAISIDLSGASRVIRLRRGEILVTTGADPEAAHRLGSKRPFWVSTPHGRMEALGTRFTVRIKDERARVSVQEGAVRLHPAREGVPIVIAAGQERWLTPDGTQPVQQEDFSADDWAEGVISGRNIRLHNLLDELQRYRPGIIACDPRVAELRLSGTYQINDTDQTLQFLVQTQPVSIDYRTRWWVTVGPERKP